MAIYNKYGFCGLFAGLGPRLCKVAPACAITISTIEYSKGLWYEYNKKKIDY